MEEKITKLNTKTIEVTQTRTTIITKEKIEEDLKNLKKLREDKYDEVISPIDEGIEKAEEFLKNFD